MAKPNKLGSDGEQAIPQPSLTPPSKLPAPSEFGADRMHSPTIPWPAPGGNDDNKPFRIRK